ncbi:cytochrome b6-f complex subunit PetL [Hydrocoleum sp. CS-953]|nr:cytochrome b6-f complex subunit PetL [Hydrocoleum sp. CS-953]OZH52247.1 cytochrome b6-f complex subunit 6 [Hydrocoleum sp. CS-953]
MTVEGIIAFFVLFVAFLGVATVLMFGLRVVKLI